MSAREFWIQPDLLQIYTIYINIRELCNSKVQLHGGAIYEFKRTTSPPLTIYI